MICTLIHSITYFVNRITNNLLVLNRLEPDRDRIGKVSRCIDINIRINIRNEIFPSSKHGTSHNYGYTLVYVKLHSKTMVIVLIFI